MSFTPDKEKQCYQVHLRLSISPRGIHTAQTVPGENRPPRCGIELGVTQNCGLIVLKRHNFISVTLHWAGRGLLEVSNYRHWAKPVILIALHFGNGFFVVLPRSHQMFLEACPNRIPTERLTLFLMKIDC